MERRAFLRGLLLAPLAVPFATKSMATDSVADSFAVVTDDKGYVIGCRSVPAFTVATVGGEPRIVIRDEYIDALNDIAAEQNARLA